MGQLRMHCLEESRLRRSNSDCATALHNCWCCESLRQEHWSLIGGRTLILQLPVLRIILSEIVCESLFAIQANLPHKIIVELIPDDGNTLSFTIDVGFYLLNQTVNAQTTAFTMPDATGLSQVDLVQANAQMGQAAVAVPPVYRSSNAASYSSSLEGYRR